MTDHPGEYPTEPTGEGSGQPEGAATPPPAPPPAAPTPPSAPAAGAAAGSSYQFDADKAKAAFQGAHKFDLGIIAAGVIAWLAGFMPFYTVTVLGISANASAYHGFFGWFGVWCCLAGAVVAVLVVLGMSLPVPAPVTVLAAFALGTVCLIVALFVFPGGNCSGVPGCDTGRGFGYWLALLCGLAGTTLAFLRYREATAAAATS